VDEYPESDGVFDGITQATAIIIAGGRAGPSMMFSSAATGESATIRREAILKWDPGTFAFPRSVDDSTQIMDHLTTFPSVESVLGHARRGEFDLSIFRNYLTDDKEGLPLVRGRDVVPFRVISEVSGRAKPSFIHDVLSAGRKGQDVERVRLVTQQVSNQAQRRRLKWSLCRGMILANSTNYIIVPPDEIPYWIAILSSAVANWFFNARSSSNHINTYEINRIPVPAPGTIPIHTYEAIASLGRQALEGLSVIDDIDSAVAAAYRLTETQARIVASAAREARREQYK
jgi:hypothetical protein